jgi:PEP-CTERM motif
MFHNTKNMSLVAAMVSTLFLADKAHADIITHTVNPPPGVIGSVHILQDDSGVFQDFSTPVTWSFNRFNPALGQLTGVQFAFSLNFLLETPNGPGVDRIWPTTSGPLSINNTVVTSGGNPVFIGYNSFGGYNFAPLAYVVNTPFAINADGPFTPLIGSGSYNFLYDALTTIDAPFSDYDLTASLQSGSSASVTYTYTPTAVPEPSSLALLAVAGAGFVSTSLRRRLRK